MRIAHSAFLCAVVLWASPARAAIVVTGTIDGEAGQSGVFDLPMFSDPGAYSGRIEFSRPGSIHLEYLVQQVFNFWCDFGDGFVNCGGDESPVGFDTFVGPNESSASLIYRILPPYRVDYSPFLYETGFYQAVGASFEYTFSEDGPVDYRAVTAPVPEPATWAVMLAGFGLAGEAMRRARAHRMRYS